MERSGRVLGGAQRRWRLGLLLVLMANLFGLHFLLAPEDMTTEENHDTRIMHKHLRYWNQPTKWLFGDWPLQNGFYRPLPALAFEADVRLWDKDFAKYKILNWIVCIASAFLLVAFVLSLTQSATVAVGAGLLLSLWQTDLGSILPLNWVAIGGALTCLSGVLFAPKSLKLRWLALAAIAFYLGFEWSNAVAFGDLSGQSFGYRTMGWPPGRTATLFGLFGLLALWGYVQWERFVEWRWLLVCLLGFLGAFMSYEQAVMLPALLLGCALFLKMKGLRVHWLLHVLFWGLMGLYAWWHLTDLPFEANYAQQHRASPWSGFRWMMLWIFPAYGSLPEIANLFDPDVGRMALLLSSFWMACLWLFVNVLVWIVARREWRLLGFGLLGSAVVFAPMAFQLRLTHYLFLPLAFRAIFVVGLTLFAWNRLSELMKRSNPAIA